MMPCGLNAHPQDFPNVSRDIAMLVRLGPTFVRVSALQFGVINKERATRVKRMVDAGLKVVGLCTSESCSTMGALAWKAYCQQYRTFTQWAGVTYDEVGNEWNTKPFWGGPPDARLAYQRFVIAQDIIGRSCIAGGVTCENKTDGKTKISAPTWIKAWLADGAAPLAWDFHYYDTDERLKSVYDECARILGQRIMVILETGSANPAKHISWFNKIKSGLWRAKPEHVLWYVYNDAKPVGFEMVDRNSNPGVLAKAILAGRP